MRRVARAIIEALGTGGALRPLESLLAPGAAIMMLHRFADAPGQHGFPLARLRETLAWLRRGGYTLLPLPDLTRTLREGGETPKRAVVFTVDDGYADFARAQPVFAEFDCPVTVFLVSGFLDGTHWMWWDQLEHVMTATGRRELALELDGTPASWTWSDGASRRSAWQDLVERLKLVPDAARLVAIARASRALEVDLPATPPALYAPMRWDDVRAFERGGATFGPHTVSHPILSRVDHEAAGREIAGSWQRVRAETAAAVPVFCYPNGDPASFGPREERLVEASGMPLAVSTMPGYANARRVRSGGAFRVPRFALPGEISDLVQIVSGIEHLKALVG